MSAAEPPQGANSAPAGGSAAAKPPAWGGHTSSASDAMEPATASRPLGNAAPPTVGAAAWHVISTAQTAEQLGSAVDGGLTAAEASQRLGVHGPNEIREQAQRSPWRMFFGQFTDFMIVLLIAAAVISGFIGEIEDAAAILAIVVLNAVIGFVQEYRAEKALRALKQLAALKARVIRDHAIVTVPAVDLVPGDLVLLEAGSVIPADLRMTDVSATAYRGGGTHRRVPSDRKADRRVDRGGPRARRPNQHGVQRDHRDVRPRARHRRRHRHGNRARQDRRRCSTRPRRCARRCRSVSRASASNCPSSPLRSASSCSCSE